MTQHLETNHAARTMGWRHGLFIRPSDQVAHYILSCETEHLHERFRPAGQHGEMMADIESIYADWCEYLSDHDVGVNFPREPELEVHHEHQELCLDKGADA